MVYRVYIEDTFHLVVVNIVLTLFGAFVSNLVQWYKHDKSEGKNVKLR